ncbi:M23 family metallopeptidase [Saccharopolyspora sp. SCSIO 74807]|uniref:M23 family metallopeptidase n=1 Tax=Saccharopolyspora sp. SCSIO 74807 TaxID=3118084 RepID=UPI0030CFA44F
MAKHSEETGQTPKPALRESLLNSFRPRPGNKFPIGNKIAAAAVAVGAFAAIGQPLAANATGGAEEHAVRPVAEQQAAPVHLPAAPAAGAQDAAKQLDKSKAVVAEQANQAPAPAAQPAAAAKPAAPAKPAAAKPDFVKPAEGTLSSGFGSRWGSSHKGIDIANKIGTPIKSVADGKVISAGPASGFGQWVRVQHNDGTITVYGHINTIDVKTGQKVNAGDKIATLGNKGKSTGPHLHFGVQKGGTKVDPQPWLQQHGISVK